MRRLLWIILFTLSGCATGPAVRIVHPSTSPLTPETRAIVWSENVGYFTDRWLAEAAHRLHDPLVFCCHGGTDINGVWTCYPDKPQRPVAVESIAKLLHDAFPARDILLIVCNPDDKPLHVARCWYAHESVWSRPGSRTQVDCQTGLPEQHASRITDFQEGIGG